MADQNDIQDLDDQLLARMLQDFLEEAPEHLDQLNLNLIQLEQDPDDDALIDEIFRTVHTLKGSSAFVGLKDISEISRKMEEVFGSVRKGAFNITAPIIGIMYEGLDVLTTLTDKAAGSDSVEVDVSPILQRLDGIPGNVMTEAEEKPDKQEAEPMESREVLTVYRQSYDQLAALKHIVYSSTHLYDSESLGVLFSKQIHERMNAEGNAVWLVEGRKVAEIAHDGKLVKEDGRRVLDIESSEVLKRVIREQLVVWSSTSPEVREMLPEFEKPVLFPIKADPEASGFLVVDPEDVAEVEVYQFVGQFASMILNISRLHHTVEEQRKELNELTEILFQQNAQLATLHHVELDLMNVSDPVHLCRIVVEAVVGDLGASKAAALLIDESSQELIGASESGGVDGIDTMRFPIDREEPIKQSIASGRVVTHRDYNENLRIGPHQLEHWVVLCFKGRERVQGVLVVEVEDEDVGDSISIVANHAGILLENLTLEKRIGSKVTEEE